MKKMFLKDLASLILVGLLFYVIDRELIDNYLWSPVFTEYLGDSPYGILAVFFMGLILYLLLAGRTTLKRFAALCLGCLFAGAATILLRLLLMQVGYALRGLTYVSGVTWSFALIYAFFIWIYGYQFGWMLRIVEKKKGSLNAARSIGRRLIWFGVCLLLAILYQKSAEFVPHTRLMDHQAELSSIVYLFAPFLGVFFEICCFREHTRANKV